MMGKASKVRYKIASSSAVQQSNANAIRSKMKSSVESVVTIENKCLAEWLTERSVDIEHDHAEETVLLMLDWGIVLLITGCLTQSKKLE